MEECDNLADADADADAGAITVDVIVDRLLLDELQHSEITDPFDHLSDAS